MTWFSIKRYLPRSLYGRAALILLVPIITIQLVVSFAFIQRLYEDVTVQMTQNIAIEIDLLVSTLETAADDETAVAMLGERASALGMEAVWPGQAVVDQRIFYDLSGRVVQQILSDRFSGLAGVDLRTNDKLVQLAIETARGPLELTFPRSRVSASNPHQLLVLMVFTAVLMTLIAYLFLRNQLRPIRRLARAAEAFGRGRVEPYAPSGAIEVRSAGNTFLNMRARIERHIEQRTLMLSGVSHDLRTPLTRLKLGLSMQEPSLEVDALLKDVGEMERLIDAFLDFARAEAVEELAETDLVELVDAIVKNAVRSGKDVEIGSLPKEPVQLKLRPLSIHRAVENLIGNAVRYGSRARVSITVLETALRVSVEDDGPGIRPDLREEALKPFARLDAARNQNEGSGLGLGLAIAADIVRSHGGSLRLGDSADLGGLSAEIVLPL
ncbi:MAG: HAMP domain-containing protein [Litoreibacter sp.]|nr:HAMP domain-containing protein [Litoreibacter sp.]